MVKIWWIFWSTRIFVTDYSRRFFKLLCSSSSAGGLEGLLPAFGKCSLLCKSITGWLKRKNQQTRRRLCRRIRTRSLGLFRRAAGVARPTPPHAAFYDVLSLHSTACFRASLSPSTAACQGLLEVQALSCVEPRPRESLRRTGSLELAIFIRKSRPQSHQCSLQGDFWKRAVLFFVKCPAVAGCHVPWTHGNSKAPQEGRGSWWKWAMACKQEEVGAGSVALLLCHARIKHV